MANFQKYPLYTYDEPATYDDFRGGINLNKSSEKIADNELRDAVNVQYIHTSLQKRYGANKLCGLIASEPLNIIQGVFLFTAKESFVVVAADGKLHYGLYNNGFDINLRRLPIISDITTDNFNPLYQLYGLPLIDRYVDSEIEHDGYLFESVIDGITQKELIFQNKRNIEAAAYNDKLYIATGTRIIEVSVEDETTLIAKPIIPYTPSGIEYVNYGMNLLSPFPQYCIRKETEATAAEIENILATPIYIDANLVGIQYEAVMIYPQGGTKDNYYFKWEKFTRDENGNMSWKPFRRFCNMETSGVNSIKLSTSDSIDDDYYYIPSYDTPIRCTFTEMFERTAIIKDNGEYEYAVEDGDWIPDKVGGGQFGSFTLNGVDTKSFSSTNNRWAIVQSCTKILVDGNKMLFYDDNYNSGEWFKTIIGEPTYITEKGGLSFKTNKNERIIKAVLFKGVIVVFSYNKLVGGNIAVVSGNGDDFSGDQNYSPYTRRVVNTEITCDCDTTVQVAENLLIFKFRNTVYAIEGSDISSDIVSVYSLNDKLNMTNSTVKIPWNEDCISEITKDYYGLIWKEDIGYENDEVYIKRPAMRLKMYYKIGQNIDDKIYFPWLRDEGSVFNADKVINIDGISTLLLNQELVQFDKEQYFDLGDSFDISIKLKAYDLNYPKLKKFIKNILLYYHHGQRSDMQMKINVCNEAGHVLIDNTTNNSTQDKATVGDDITSGKVGTAVTDTKVYTPLYLFQLLQAYTDIVVHCDDSFVFNSITFNYVTTKFPVSDTANEYSKIIRKPPTILNRRTLNVEEIDIPVVEEVSYTTIIYENSLLYFNDIDVRILDGNYFEEQNPVETINGGNLDGR